MIADNKRTTPLNAAKMAYVMCAEQVLHDEQAALEFACVDKISRHELAEFHNQLKKVARRIRWLLFVRSAKS